MPGILPGHVLDVAVGTILTGAGKKVYRCPLRRRPVSDSVPIQNFIVSDATKDLRACERITHETKVRPWCCAGSS